MRWKRLCRPRTPSERPSPEHQPAPGKGWPPPRPGAWNPTGVAGAPHAAGGTALKLHSDSFTGKKLGSAVREYLEMRKQSGGDAPATSREIFDALKEGGFVSGAKDDATALVVLRTILRKNTVTFAKLQNGKYGLRAWYPNFKTTKETTSDEAGNEDSAEAENVITVDGTGTATAKKGAA